MLKKEVLKLENNKLNILYDVTLLKRDLKNKSIRSGIFFVGWNLLTEMLKNPNVNLILYDRYNDKKNIDNLKNKLCAYDLKILPPNLKFTNEERISKTKNKIKKATATHNSFSIFTYSLMLILLKIINIFLRENKTLFDNIDAYFSVEEAAPNAIAKQKHIKKYTILHDAIPIILKEYSGEAVAGSVFDALTNSLNPNDNYFTVSNSTKNDFIRLFPLIDKEKITVIQLGKAEYFKPSKEKVLNSLIKYNLPTDKKYIFSLSTLDPRKNFKRTVKTFIDFLEKNNIDDMIYVLGGGAWHKKKNADILEELIPKKYQDKIIRAGYIDDNDLPALYSGAEWFVFTSQYEGFGLPPLEAMACECPVITSNNSSLPEVVNNAGIMIDWDSDEQHVEAFEKYYFDKEYREQMAKKGYERSKEFSWQKCADVIITTMLNDKKAY